MTLLTPLAMVAAVLATTSPAVVELDAEQRAPTPQSDRDDPLTFHLDVRARCADAEDKLQVAASLGDTLSDWQDRAPGQDHPPLVLAVPRTQLVVGAATLCARRNDDTAVERELAGAFTAQIVARCTGADGRASERSTPAALAVRFTCPAAEDANDAIEDTT